MSETHDDADSREDVLALTIIGSRRSIANLQMAITMDDPFFSKQGIYILATQMLTSLAVQDTKYALELPNLQNQDMSIFADRLNPLDVLKLSDQDPYAKAAELSPEQERAIGELRHELYTQSRRYWEIEEEMKSITLKREDAESVVTVLLREQDERKAAIRMLQDAIKEIMDLDG